MAAATVRLRDVLTPGRTVIAYTYDLGDNWEHELVASNVRPGTPGVAYPHFIAGGRNGPIEDCGGIRGFQELLAARADPDHPDHDEAKAWLDDYDLAEFDELPVKVALGRIAARRNAAAARILKPKT